MRVRQRARRRSQHLKRHRDRQRTLRLDDVLERPALDELHRHEQESPRLTFAIDRNDVGMLERRGEARLALEALGQLVAQGHFRGQHLERDTPAEARLGRPVYDGHRAAPDLPIDLVLTGERVTHFGQERIVGRPEQQRGRPWIDYLASAARTESRAGGDLRPAPLTGVHWAATVKSTTRRLIPLPYAASTVDVPAELPNVICTSASPLALVTRSTEPDPSTLPVPVAMRKRTETPATGRPS